MSVPEGWPTKEMQEVGNRIAATYGVTSAVPVFRAMLAAAPTPPAQEVEPVAFQITLPDGRVFYRGVPTFLKNHTNVPLYTHPQSDELRKAAEEFTAYFKAGADVDRSVEQVMAFLDMYENKLRTTLEKYDTPPR